MSPPPDLPTHNTDAVPFGAGLVVASVVSLQSGAVLAVLALEDLGPVSVASLRMLVAALLLLAFLRPAGLRDRLRDRVSVRLAMGLGLCLAAMHVLIYESLDRVPIGLATTLEALGPLALAAATSRRRADLALVSLAGVGVVLAASPAGGETQLVGVLFGLLAGVCWAGYIELNKRCAERFVDTFGLMVGFAFGGLVLLPWALVGLHERPMTLQAAALLPVIALLSSALPFSLETRALRTISKHLFGVLTSLYPGIGALLGLALLDQRLSVGQVVGIGVVVAASAGAVAVGRARRGEREPVGGVAVPVATHAD